MTSSQIRLKYPRDTFFSRGDRNVWLAVDDLEHRFQIDDHRPNRTSLELEFSLPRGAYATMLVKYIMASDSLSLDSEIEDLNDEADAEI
jgi:tRNA pseudouridine13 synthase